MGYPDRTPIPSAHDTLIREICKAVTAISGVQLGDRQRSMVEARLQKRVLDLKLRDMQDYAAYYDKHKQSEVSALISILTTHHTFFFREYSHFEYLERFGLEKVVKAVRARGEKKIRIWSAACSRGQEVYSLSMFLRHHLRKIAPDFTFEILGTDIDPESVSIAKNGVFHRNEIKEIPMHLISGNWAKGTGEIQDYVKAKPSIKEFCRFETLNLLKIQDLSKFNADIIFCRNVFIYFTPEQVKEITKNLFKKLSLEGILFIGISESLNGMGLPIRSLGPSIYAREDSEKGANKVTSLPTTSALASAMPTILRVLCVDDSPSVLTLLKQVLKRENGFDVVATATNGIEAAKKLKENQIDLMTLDIHMPEQTGLEYLQRNMSSGHPPVVMISSVSRENADLAMNCLESGASDYIEKPALSNLKEKGEEIRTKLLCAFRNKSEGGKVNYTLDKSFKSIPIIRDPDCCFRLIFAGMGDRKKLQAFFSESKGTQPATVILFEGCEATISAFVKASNHSFGGRLVAIEKDLPALIPGKIYVADFGKFFSSIKEKYHSKRTSILLYGQATGNVTQGLLSWGPAQLLLEDLGKLSRAYGLCEVATDRMPATSFAYCSTEYLSVSHVK